MDLENTNLQQKITDKKIANNTKNEAKLRNERNEAKAETERISLEMIDLIQGKFNLFFLVP